MHASNLAPTAVYDSYWYFAAERQAMYERRLSGAPAPWTDHPVLRAFRFTNAFRAADRVSQYLISEVQYRSDRSQEPSEIFFRTLLFKLFNRVETWKLLERTLGQISSSIDLNKVASTLDVALARNERIYSAAYIMPPPQLGHKRKHNNHLALIEMMMRDQLPQRLDGIRSLREVYQTLKPYPGLGPFLAFQYAIDLSYSNLVECDEGDFVVAGPGALDGIAKCFGNVASKKPESVIYEMVDRQDREFQRLNLTFNGLFGRKLQPIDCQNLFCEISKFARVAHPEAAGLSGRTRIKQSYRGPTESLPSPQFPPRWNLRPPPSLKTRHLTEQYSLFM